MLYNLPGYCVEQRHLQRIVQAAKVPNTTKIHVQFGIPFEAWDFALVTVLRGGAAVLVDVVVLVVVAVVLFLTYHDAEKNSYNLQLC